MTNVPATRPGSEGEIRAAYAFAHRLSRARNAIQLHQIITDTCARAVGAEKASLALSSIDRGSLTITATVGYPHVLVRRLRFRPGVGIIGGVFRTGRALHVDDMRRFINVPAPRLRYRTTSFMSVPLHGAAGVLGVLNVSDPLDGGEFRRTQLGVLRALSSVAGIAIDRWRAIAEAAAYARVAAIDPLTGLFNRRHFELRLAEEVERSRRQGSPLAVLMFDVDDFKQLNDRLGHVAGDAVLRIVADVLARSVRFFDVCARYGGDEFAVIMPGSGHESTRQIAERIRVGIADSRPSAGPWADDIRVTASIGSAIFAGTTGADLMQRADEALYEAKRMGKNRFFSARRAEPEAL